MMNGLFALPKEPCRERHHSNPRPGQRAQQDIRARLSERASLKKRLDEMLKEVVDIPAIIGGKEVRTGRTLDVVCPHDHKHKLGVAHQVSEKEVQQAIEASRKAWIEWSETGWRPARPSS